MTMSNERNSRFTSRREFVKALGLGTALTASSACSSLSKSASGKKPNLVVIFADDMGYGDMATFGHPTIKTPNLDNMAEEGMKFTQFYSACSVCTPSRAALMTGRLPIRSGMCSDKRRVLFPNSGGGLPESEITIAKALKGAGYATGCVGKWHLGHLPQFLPTRNGFDEYFGIPYSNDMAIDPNMKLADDVVLREGMTPERIKTEKPKGGWAPLFESEEVAEYPTDQTTLTKRYTQRAVEFIKKNNDHPFFLYFPHSFPHIPLFASKDFLDKSLRGLFGDVIEELDWSVGEVLKTLKKQGLAENTLVIFTSDNGPWLTFNERGGSAGLLRGGKGSTWEGGMREPTLAWWPGKIAPGSISRALTTTMDIFPTALALAGVAEPKDRVIDGMNILPVLEGKTDKAHDTYFYYRGQKIFAARKGPWKAHFTTQAGYRDKPHPQDPPELYHLEHDPSEKYNLAKKHPEVIAEIKKEVERHKATVKPVVNQLEIPMPK